MNILIRPMTADDVCCVAEMMREFYASPAILSNGSESIFKTDIENCIGSCPFLEGYVFQNGDEIHGYAMIAKSFSTEFGKPCLWIEDLYIKECFRGTGIGSHFLKYIDDKYQDHILRLEVEDENERAINVYKKQGFVALPYREMIKNN